MVHDPVVERTRSRYNAGKRKKSVESKGTVKHETGSKSALVSLVPLSKPSELLTKVIYSQVCRSRPPQAPYRVVPATSRGANEFHLKPRPSPWQRLLLLRFLYVEIILLSSFYGATSQSSRIEGGGLNEVRVKTRLNLLDARCRGGMTAMGEARCGWNAKGRRKRSHVEGSQRQEEVRHKERTSVAPTLHFRNL